MEYAHATTIKVNMQISITAQTYLYGGADAARRRQQTTSTSNNDAFHQFMQD